MHSATAFVVTLRSTHHVDSATTVSPTAPR